MSPGQYAVVLGSTKRKCSSTTRSVRRRRSTHPSRTPAIHDVESDDFVLVVEDPRSSSHDGSAHRLLARRRRARFALAASRCVLNDPRFDSPGLAWQPLSCDPPTPEGVVQTFADCWPRFLEVFGDEIVPEIRRVGEWVPAQPRAPHAARGPPAHAHAQRGHPSDNLFFHDDGGVSGHRLGRSTQKGPGGVRLHVLREPEPHDRHRRAQWDGLAAIYLDALAAAGAVYPPDQFWLDVKRTLLFCLVYPVQVASLDLSDPHSLELLLEIGARAMSRRSSSATRSP